MAARSSAERSESDRELVIERTFEAPRELVWSVWTDPAHADQWWGPNGFRNETLAFDFRTGGTWRYVMHGPDGRDWPNWIRYDEIVERERLAYAHGAEEGGEPHFHVVVTFTAVSPKRTRVSMRSVFPSAEACRLVKEQYGAVEGGEQTLARLAGHLEHAGDAAGAMVLTRVFAAPAKAVFEAWSKPEALARWWGPKHFTLPVCEVDFRPGGSYRMVMRGPDGQDYPFHGTYREIVPNRRIVFNAVIADLPGNDVLTTVTFVEEDGKTRLTVTQTRPALAPAAKGQREGWSGSLEKLAAALGIR